MPVADIEALAHAQRMMTTRGDTIVPWIGLAAGFPLTGDPPSPDLARAGGIGEIQDHHDIADVALDGRRDVGVASVEIEAVHAAAGRAPFADQLRIARPRDVVDRDSSAELGDAALSELLVIDDHDAVRRTHLVGMPALRQVDARKLARVAGIGHVHDGGTARGLHMARHKGSCPRPTPVRRRDSRSARRAWCSIGSARVPDSEVRKHLRHPLMRTSESKGALATL